ASAPPLAFMTVDSGTRWLPEPLNLRLKVGAGVPPSGPTTGWHPPQSFGRRPNGGGALSKSRVIGRLKWLRTLTPKKPYDFLMQIMRSIMEPATQKKKGCHLEGQPSSKCQLDTGERTGRNLFNSARSTAFLDHFSHQRP